MGGLLDPPNPLAGLLGAYDPVGDYMRALPATPTPGGNALSRAAYPSEQKFFWNNPRVAGMAAEDNRVVMNPYASLTPEGRQSVQNNEALRIAMRTGQVPAPAYGLTPYQSQAFAGYSTNMQDRRETIAARLMSGDPSAGIPSPDQRNYLTMMAQILRGGQ